MLLNWTIPMHVDCNPAQQDGEAVRAKSDVVDTGEGYRIHVEMPGVAPADLEIQVENDSLTVKGTRAAIEQGGKHLHDGRGAERPFVGRFRLGRDIDRSAIQARLENGLLTLVLPRREDEKPKRIEVQLG